MAPPTILSLKANFVANQTRLLSQPLNPSQAWREANRAAEDGISEKAVDDALFRLNHALQQHSRRVHAPQAVRHVAEQIDWLYGDAADTATDATSQPDGVDGLKLGADLTDPETIDALPAAWQPEQDVNAHPMEARQYAELVDRLRTLSSHKTRVGETVLRLRLMNDMLQPFQSDDEGRGVQENLITRNGEVEKELERMRMLLARVGARLGHLHDQSRPDGGGGPISEGDHVLVDDIEAEEKRKVNDLLSGL